MAVIFINFLLLQMLIEGCSNTSYKQSISNDNCTKCPANTISNMNRTKCVCKDGYYNRSSDNSEASPCYGKFLLPFSVTYEQALCLVLLRTYSRMRICNLYGVICIVQFI